jgi:chromosome segregation ATPase
MDSSARDLAHDDVDARLREAMDANLEQERTIAEQDRELRNLQQDLDTLLELLEEEKKVNTELEKMVQASDKTAASLRKENGALKAKLKNKGVDVAPLEEQNRLRKQVEVLTASQAHLIESLDASADELDRVTRENAALCEAVARLKASCVAYENQVEEHVAVSGRLKDFLEEGAQYIDGKVENVGGGEGEGRGDEGSEGAELRRAQAHVASLEDSVTRWQAKCGTLEVHVLALCAELTRLSTSAGGMQAFVASALETLEGQVASV